MNYFALLFHLDSAQLLRNSSKDEEIESFKTTMFLLSFILI